MLVIPKEHYVDVAAVAAAGGGLLEEMTRLAHSIAVDEGIGGSGYRVVFNSGPDAGQEVPHAHVIGAGAWSGPPGSSRAARLAPGVALPRGSGRSHPERRDMRLTPGGYHGRSLSEQSSGRSTGSSRATN